MASTLFRFRHAAIALSECAPSLAVLESTLLKSHNISRPLVSLRSFASGPENTPPSASPPPQEGTSQAKKQPEEATPGKPEATTSEDERPPNPILEALREQIKMQMMQLRSQSTMLEQTMEDTFVMYFSPENHPKVAHMDVEDQEFYTDPQVDVGEVMVQYVCLSLEDFPICPDHQVHEGGRAGADIPLAQVEKKNPFEILQALIKKENGS